jgi:hypothetical protein
MISESKRPESVPDNEIEQEIRQARKFSAEEVIGRLAGPGAMKDGSPISRQQQAENAIGAWLTGNLNDVSGALKAVLHRNLKGSGRLLQDLDRPLAALADYCERILASDERLLEIVRETDVEWGRAMDERPHFERAGGTPHPDDPYTMESVRAALRDAVQLLRT